MQQKKEFSAPPKRVALFVTCMVDMLYPEVGMAAVELLERQGIEVIFPLEQTCCGQPAFNAGYRDEARPLAQRFVDLFEPLVRSGQVDALVAPSGSCVAMTTNFYDVLFESDPIYRQRAAILGSVTFELTEFLVDVLGVTDVGARFEGKMAYHASCHLLRELHVDRQPRTLLDHVVGAEQVALVGGDECCGFGGLFAVKNAAISSAMGRRKTQNLAASEADVAVLCDVSCMTHINGLLARQGQHCRAVHIAQLLTNEVEVMDRSPAEKAAAPKQAPSRRWQDDRG